MPNRKDRLMVLVVLVLIIALVALAGCGQEEGKRARELADRAAEDALDFAEGFCGAALLAPLWIAAVVATRRYRRR